MMVFPAIKQGYHNCPLDFFIHYGGPEVLIDEDGTIHRKDQEPSREPDHRRRESGGFRGFGALLLVVAVVAISVFLIRGKSTRSSHYYDTQAPAEAVPAPSYDTSEMNQPSEPRLVIDERDYNNLGPVYYTKTSKGGQLALYYPSGRCYLTNAKTAEVEAVGNYTTLNNGVSVTWKVWNENMGQYESYERFYLIDNLEDPYGAYWDGDQYFEFYDYCEADDAEDDEENQFGNSGSTFDDTVCFYAESPKEMKWASYYSNGECRIDAQLLIEDYWMSAYAEGIYYLQDGVLFVTWSPDSEFQEDKCYYLEDGDRRYRDGDLIFRR